MPSTGKTVFIAVLGAGGVGSYFLEQLAWLTQRRQDVQLRLCYLATIDGSLYHKDYSAIDASKALETFVSQASALLPLSEAIEYLAGAPGRVIIVDNTSSNEIAKTYPAFLSRGLCVITPNKKAFSGSFKLFRDVFDSAATGNSFVYHESSVGAGMPIISTIFCIWLR